MGERPYDLIVAKWPMADARLLDPEAQKEIDWLIRLVSEIRSARAELNVPPGSKVDLVAWADVGIDVQGRMKRNEAVIESLARVREIRSTNLGVSGAAAQIIVDGATFVLPLQGVIDVSAEKARLSKAIAVATKDRDGLAARLANSAFTDRAKPEAVAKAREDHDARAAEAERLGAALARLG